MGRLRGTNLPQDFLRGALKRLESGNQHMRQDEEVHWPLIVLVEAPQYAGGDELAQHSPSVIHILAVRQVRLFRQKLRAVDEQAINDGDVVLLVQLVDERADDTDVKAHIAKLLQR
jgi:hypothetical protein